MVSSSRVKAFSGKLQGIGTRLENGKIEFGPARENEITRLKELYDGAWGKDLKISTDQIGAAIANFREGQIVGRLEGRPISMISVMLTSYGEVSGVKGTYDQTTGNRTFSTHIKPDKLLEIVRDTASIPIAVCASVAVDLNMMRNGAAVETINYARKFANESGLYAVPYSAPRSFGEYLREYGSIGISEYLTLTKPRKQEYGTYCDGLLDNQRMRAIAKLLEGAEIPLTEGQYNERSCDLRDFEKRRTKYLNEIVNGITVEEFSIAYGRELFDVVLGMHMKNGARFIRDGNGTVVTFDNSRLDPSARNYNVPMTYDPHPYFNNDYF
jgi:hypothetical protein